MGRRGIARRSLSRRGGMRPTRRTIVVFCEGTETEPEYVKGLKSLESIRARTAVRLELDPGHSAPLPLVEAAVEAAHDDEIDEVWCLFDVEAPQPHPNLSQAFALAARSGVNVAASNPCFELWLLLHERDRTSALMTGDAEAAAQRLKAVSGKHLDVEYFLARRNDAARRARLLDVRHEGNSTPAPGNPSSGMYRFLKAVDPDYDDGLNA